MFTCVCFVFNAFHITFSLKVGGDQIFGLGIQKGENNFQEDGTTLRLKKNFFGVICLNILNIYILSNSDSATRERK